MSQVYNYRLKRFGYWKVKTKRKRGRRRGRLKGNPRYKGIPRYKRRGK